MSFDETLPVVMVEWNDHHMGGDRMGITVQDLVSRARFPLVIRTYGALVREDEEKYTIAYETRGDEDLASPLFLQWTFILKATVIRVVRLIPTSHNEKPSKAIAKEAECDEEAPR